MVGSGSRWLLIATACMAAVGCGDADGADSGAGGATVPVTAAGGSVGAGAAAVGGANAGTASPPPVSGTGATPGGTGGGAAPIAGGAAMGRDAGGVDAGAGTGGAADAGSPPATGDDLCDVGVYDGTPPEVLSLSGNTFAHDPTMIEADGVYYRFWTGDDIPVATSTDLRSWQNAPSVYQGGYPDWVGDWLAGVPGQTFNFPWAPDVSFFDGRHHLYSSFSARFGDNVSCITHLSTADIAGGQWTDHGPVICTEGDEPYNAIDADVGFDGGGAPWLAFGSFWDGIMLMPLDATGASAGGELTRLAWAPEIEAPVLFRRCGYHYLFVTWGLCCPGAGRSVAQLSYRVAVGRAEDIRGPYVDRDGVPLLDGGGTLVVEGDGVQFAAAGHSDVMVSGDAIYHLYHAYRLPSGNAELRIVELPFDEEGWPVPGGP